jgi:hypothetical protein
VPSSDRKRGRFDDLPSMQDAKRVQNDKCEEIACFGDAQRKQNPVVNNRPVQ